MEGDPKLKSHIQLPKSILKHFIDPDDKKRWVWYLDIPSGVIKKASPSVLGTSTDYYSGTMEALLNADIESPVSKILCKIRSFCDSLTEAISLSKKDITTIKLYAKCLIARSDYTLDCLYNTSIYASLFSEQHIHDFLIGNSMSKYTDVDSLLMEYELNIIINGTNRSFVIPRSGLYSIPKKDGKHNVIVPISPKAAIMLIPPSKSPLCTNNSRCPILINKENTIMEFNIYALIHEFAFNKSFIASDKKCELEHIANYTKNNQHKLDQIRANIRSNLK